MLKDRSVAGQISTRETSKVSRGVRRWDRRVVTASIPAAATLLLWSPTVSFAANGTAQYIDFNGATAGFGTPTGTPDQLSTIWTTDNTGSTATTAYTSGDQMTFGAVSGDTSLQGTFSVNLNQATGQVLNGIVVNSTGLNVTLTGTANVHPTSSSTWTVAAGSTLTESDTRQTSGSTTGKGLNFNNQTITMTGGGTINIATALGANSTGSMTVNMSGGTVNLQQTATTGVNGFAGVTGSFTLTNGTLNLASAGSLIAFNGFGAGKLFNINGGTIDNTSGSAGTLNIGSGSYSIGGDFAFAGSNSLDLGTNAVAIAGTTNRNITVTNNTLTMGGSITGGATSGITKLGAGTLKLTAANTYNGAVTVSAGTLDVSTSGYALTATQTFTNNATVLGAVSANAAGQIITGTGTYSSNVNVTGGTFTPGTSSATGTLASIGGNLNISGSGVFKIKVGGASSDQITTLTGSANFVNDSSLSVSQLSAPTNSSYTILTAGSGITGLTAGIFQTIGRTTYSINSGALAANTLMLDIGGGPATIIWNNSGGTAPADGSTWDIQTTPTTPTINQNWNSSTGVGGSGGANGNDFYYDGDAVVFNDNNNGNFTVNLASTVSPGSVTVANTSGTYVFGGGGSIAGLTGLTKNGAGTLTINTTNAYSGNTTLNNGLVNIGAAGALGSGRLVINAGSIDNTSGGALTLANNNPQTWGGSFTFVGTNDLNLGTGAVTLTTSPTVTVTNGTLTVGGAISGTGNGIIKAGTGTLVLGAVSSFNGGLTINAGTVQSNSNNVGTTAIGSGNVTINAGGTLAGNAKDAFGFAPNAAPATINIAGGTVTDTASGSYRITLPNLNFTGGTLTSNASNAGDAQGNYSFFGNGTTATITTNASSTQAVISATAVSMQKPTTFNVATGSVSGGVDLLVSSNIVINGNNALTKSGTGTMALSGNNTYTSATTVAMGTLQLVSSTSTNNIPGSPTISVSSGATLDVSQITASGGFTLSGTQTVINNGTVTGAVTAASAGQTLTGTGSYTGNVTVSGGTLTPGTTAAVGTLAGMNNLTVSGSGLLNLKFNGASADSITSFTGAASFASNSSIKIQQIVLPTNPSYTIFNAAGGITGLTGGGLIQAIGRTTYTVDAGALGSNTLQIDVAGAPGSDIWTGADSGTDPTRWDNIQSNANWLASGAGVVDTTHFYDADSIIFDTAHNAGHSAINIDTNVAPASITATNGGGTTYTITGNGGVITGAGSLTMNSSDGTGTLVLANAANTFTGVTTLTSGTLSVSQLANGGTASAIGQSSNAAANLVLDGGTLMYTGGAQSSDRLFTLTTNGGTIAGSGSGALTLSNTGSVALSGAGARTLTLAGSTAGNTLAALINDSAPGNTTGLHVSGTGSWIVTAANTYTGNTTIDNGATLQVGTGANTTSMIGNATAVAASTGNISVSGALSFSYSGSPGAFNNTVSGNGTITLLGNGHNFSIKLDGDNTGFTGIATAVGNGTNGTRLQWDNVNSLFASTSSIVIQNGSALFYTVGAANNYMGAISIAGNGWINDGAGGTGAIRFGAAGPNVISGTVTLSANSRIAGTAGTVAGKITGPFGLDIGATATVNSNLAISNPANDWTGNTTINATTKTGGNILQLGADNVIPDGAGKGNLIINGDPTNVSELDMNGHNETVNGLTSGGTAGNAKITNTAASTVSTLTAGNNDQTSTFAGVILDGAGTVGLTKIGAGTLTISGTNAYSAGTIVNQGTLTATQAGGLGSGDVLVNPTGISATAADAATLNTTGAIAPTANVTVNTNSATAIGTINVFSATPTWGSLAGSGNVVFNSGSPTTFTVGNANNTLFSGVISEAGGAASGALVKQGSGMLTLSGANIYTGNTTVNVGTLTIAAGTGSIASNNVTVAAGATLNAYGSLPATANVTTTGASGSANFGAPLSTVVSTQQLATLSIAASSTSSITTSMHASAPKTLQVGTLTFGDTTNNPSTSTIDVTNNVLIASGLDTDAEAMITSHKVATTTAGLILGYKQLTTGPNTFEIRATLLGDSDLNGNVNVADLANLAGNFGKTSGQNWLGGDFDYNGNVNVADLSDLAGNFGKDLDSAGFGSGGGAAASPAAATASAAVSSGAAVPEPASLGLLGVGAIALLTRRRRRNAARNA
jgi:autotransporter-associated beta strand protein